MFQSFMDINEKWWPPLYGVEIFKSLVRAIKPEHRKIFISEMLLYMEKIQPKSTTVDSSFSTSATCASALSSILLDEQMEIPELNVIEAVTSIIHILDAWLAHDTSEDLNRHKEVAKHMIKLRLTACIASTAGAIYYDLQIQDTLTLLFQLISIRASLELRQCLITAMKQIMKKNRDILLSSDGKNRQYRLVPAACLLPNLNLLLDTNPGIRVDFALMLICYLEQISDTDK
ncbi:plasma membrane localization protein [Umbelopsis sp. WA50703]